VYYKQLFVRKPMHHNMATNMPVPRHMSAQEQLDFDLDLAVEKRDVDKLMRLIDGGWSYRGLNIAWHNAMCSMHKHGTEDDAEKDSFMAGQLLRRLIRVEKLPLWKKSAVMKCAVDYIVTSTEPVMEFAVVCNAPDALLYSMVTDNAVVAELTAEQCTQIVKCATSRGVTGNHQEVLQAIVKASSLVSRIDVYDFIACVSEVRRSDLVHAALSQEFDRIEALIPERKSQLMNIERERALKTFWQFWKHSSLNKE
jgi:hypothetical protein